MREDYFVPFATIGDAYVMTESEQRALRNKLLALQKHHARCLHQLQWYMRRGALPSDMAFKKIDRRVRSLEKRIGTAEHRLAHAHIYEEFTQPQQHFGWHSLIAVVRSVWHRVWPHRHGSRKMSTN